MKVKRKGKPRKELVWMNHRMCGGSTIKIHCLKIKIKLEMGEEMKLVKYKFENKKLQILGNPRKPNDRRENKRVKS